MNSLTPYQRHKIGTCSACGLCLPVCPTYNLSRREEDSPRGRLSLLAGVLKGEISQDGAIIHFLRCVLCGQCDRACPAHIPLTSIFFAIRSALVKSIPLSFLQKLFAPALTANQKAVDFLQTPASLLCAAYPRLPNPPPPAWVFPPQETRTARVLFFPGCLGRRFSPRVMDLGMRILQKAGLRILALPELVCCGRPLAVQGKSVLKALRKNFAIIQTLSFETLVTPCPGCLAMFREIIPSLAGLSDAERAFAQELAAKCIHIADMAHMLFSNSFPPPSGSARIWWHKPCLLPPRASFAEKELLRKSGCEILEAGTPAQCCGAAASCVNLPKPNPVKDNWSGDLWRQPQNSRPLAQILPAQIRRAAASANAEAIITACPACLLKLRQLTSPLDKLPSAYALEIWGAVVLEDPFPWRAAMESQR